MLTKRSLFSALFVAGRSFAAAARANVGPTQNFGCQIEPRQTVYVRSSVDGVIDKLYVHRGDDVKRGELLATLGSGPQRAALAVARARAAMQEEYKLAVEQLREAHEKQHLAALEVKSAEQELDERSIRSPVNGIVAKIMLRPGERAEVFPQAPVGGKYLARVEIVDPVVDAASDTFGVRLRLPNPHDRVPAGIECRVRF